MLIPAEALMDELDKIAEVSLAGVSPAVAMSIPQPEPTETPGIQKAKAIMAKMEKNAARTGYEKARDVVAPAVGGAAVGNMLASLSHKAPSLRRRIAFAGAGALVSAIDRHKMKSINQTKAGLPKVAAAFGSPALALKASRQVGTAAPMRSRIGPSLAAVTAKVPSLK